jgi:sentrin-specific protease 8
VEKKKKKRSAKSTQQLKVDMSVQRRAAAREMGGNGSGDPVVVSYGDIALRQSDVDLLAVGSREWLNDAVVSFSFELLNKQHPRVECLHASTTNLLTMPISTEIQREMAATIRTLVVREGKGQQPPELVLAAVNNSMDPLTAESGSHWSLLVYEASNQTFWHFDSSGALNQSHARDLSKQLGDVLVKDEWKYREAKAPMQTNGYACGYYTIAIAMHLCEEYSNKLIMEECIKDINHKVSPERVENVRGELLSLIRSIQSNS